VAIEPSPGDAIEVAMTAEGLVALAIPATGGATVIPIELRMITASVLRGAKVARGADVTSEDLVLVTCRSDDDELRRWFIRVGLGLLRPAQGGQDASAITAAIIQLAQLFELATRPARKKIVGLWGELLVMCAASDAAAMLASWRSAADEPFDFARDSERLEVKASLSSPPVHHFSDRQLRPERVSAWIVTVPVTKQGSGASIHDLADELRGRVANDAGLIAKVDRVLMEELGGEYGAAATQRFDRETATAGLELYEAGAVPCVPVPLPDGVISSRMIVNLDYAQPSPRPPRGCLPGLIFA
jgi:hypothetical protein